jgi:hypothetical protein
VNAHDYPHALARRWVEEYSEHLFLSLALRELVRRRVNRGAIRQLVTARSFGLLETTDQLAAFGLRPAVALAGPEADLWGHTVRYAARIPWLSPPAGVALDVLAADLCHMQGAWDEYEEAVARLPDDFFEESAFLAAGAGSRHDGAADRFGPTVAPTAIV